ncbi:hypothetical protein [Metamycoplasma equirhinis]|uniref:hypothetical protein n=1 Tax=Metamycoplasma equirhinis TaxID=92402 RepID=UPI003593893D
MNLKRNLIKNVRACIWWGTYIFKKIQWWGYIKIPKWICISTFNARRYWLIDASKYTNYIYGLDQLNKEINVKDRTSIDEFGATHYSYNDSGLLASAIENLREKLKKF